MIPVRGGEVSGEMHLLSYAQTAPGARLTVITRARGEFVPPGIEPGGMYQPFAVFPVHQFTATDDHGTSYRTGFRGRRGQRPDELAGEITLDPGPPPGTRWLDLTTAPGGPAVRIDLTPRSGPDGAGVTIRQAGTSPGEHLLHHMADRLLLLALAFPHQIRLHPAVPPPEPFSCVADGLGDAIAALHACGALSALSPVPGQLAALCAALDVSGHGITARPARQLPGPWLSMLAHYHRRTPDQALGRDGCAAAAAALPELDGIRLAILGLHNADGRTVLYGHASGMTPPGPRRAAGRGNRNGFPAEDMGPRQPGAVARHPRHRPPLERGRRPRDDTAPRGRAAAEPGHHLDRDTRRRAIGPGARHAAASLALAAGIYRPARPGAATGPAAFAAARNLPGPGLSSPLLPWKQPAQMRQPRSLPSHQNWPARRSGQGQWPDPDQSRHRWRRADPTMPQRHRLGTTRTDDSPWRGKRGLMTQVRNA